MKANAILSTVVFAWCNIVCLPSALGLGVGSHVVSYDPGSTPAPGGYTNPNSALGAPERFTGEGVFPSVVSPFSSPFLTPELVSIGEGGQLTLRLTNFVNPDATGPEIGVFTNATLVDVDGNFSNPAATTSDEPVATFGVDSALVEVSEDGVSWTSLGIQEFDIPTNGYTDLTDPFSSVPGTVESAFDQPFTSGLSAFAGLDYYDAGNTDVIDVLGGSGGGTWLDISGTSLSEISWIRFSLADDSDSNTSLNFELDAITIATGALGTAVPEPTAAALYLMTFGTFVFWSRRLLP